jgi:hypothetical protein
MHFTGKHRVVKLALGETRKIRNDKPHRSPYSFSFKSLQVYFSHNSTECNLVYSLKYISDQGTMACFSLTHFQS